MKIKEQIFLVAVRYSGEDGYLLERRGNWKWAVDYIRGVMEYDPMATIIYAPCEA